MGGALQTATVIAAADLAQQGENALFLLQQVINEEFETEKQHDCYRQNTCCPPQIIC